MPGALVVASDVSRRASVMGLFTASSWPGYLLAVVVSATLWGSLLGLAARRGKRSAVVVAVGALMAGILVGWQRYFFVQYGTYLNRDAVFFGTTFVSTLRRTLAADGAGLARALLPALVTSLLVALAARRKLVPSVPGRPTLAALVVAASLAAFSPWSYRGSQAATPDVLYLHGLGGLLLSRLGVIAPPPQSLPGRRTPEYLPALVARPSRPRNVVFVLTESVRADVVCMTPGPGCQTTPFSDAATPHRMPLRQLRANASSTAISVAVTLTGIPPESSRDEVHRAPTLWEYARAAGYDTAYWTSQDLRGINSDMFVREVGARIQVQGYEIDDTADVAFGASDALLSERVARDLPQLREPFVAVVHYANTHFPYWVDEKKSPFQPSESTKDPSKNDTYFNFYKNSVYLQDESIGALLRTLRAAPSSDRTIVVFTSDHGEAFREHSQMAHTLSVYDEEIHVPGWIDAPGPSLTPDERRALEQLADEPIWHLDMLPTFLDLLGLADAPALARFRARMPGASWLRQPLPERLMSLTNCTAVWSCAFRNWGLMRGPLKLEARAWDPDWHCWNTRTDPGETHDLGVGACGDLASQAIKRFGSRPGDP